MIIAHRSFSSEAFDKAAKILGLGYPGGPAIEEAAKSGNPTAIKLPIPRQRYHDCHFSFSGLKTALANAASTHPEPLPISDFAASMQSAISASLVSRAAIAMEQRAKVMGKSAEAAVYRAYIEKMKKKTKKM